MEDMEKEEDRNIRITIPGGICCSCFKDLVENEDGRMVCPDRCF